MKKLFPVIFFLISLSGAAAQDEISFENLLPDTPVNAVTTDGVDFWIATNGLGIFRYNSETGSMENYSTAKGNLQHDFFYCIAAAKDFVWAGSTDGLFILDKKRNQWTKRKFGLGGQLSNWIRSIAYDKYENAVWIGRFKYLTKLDLKNHRFTDYDLTVNGNEKTNTIQSIRVDGDSLVWFGTEGGLHKYDKSKNLSDPSAVKFYDNRLNNFNGEGEQVSISAILLDRNYVWIGLDEFITPERPDYNVGGLFRFDRNNEWLRFDYSSGLPGNGISALARTGNYIWAALYQFGKTSKDTYGRGLIIINRLTNKVTQIRNQSIPERVNDMLFDGKNLWLAGDSGLIKIELFNKLALWNTGDKK